MSGNPALNRTIRNALYQLKLRYGAPISVYRMTSSSTDLKTGVRTNTKESYDIELAAVLSSNEARKYFASLSFISSAKSFVSPGQQGWDQNRRGFVIDGEDLRDFEWDPEDWIVYRDKRYEVEVIEALEHDTGWLIWAKQLKGNTPKRIINLNVTSTLEADQEATQT